MARAGEALCAKTGEVTGSQPLLCISVCDKGEGEKHFIHFYEISDCQEVKLSVGVDYKGA